MVSRSSGDRLSYVVGGNALSSASGQALTAGLSSVRFAGIALMDGSAGSPEILFNNGSELNVAGLFHTDGGGEALVVLDASWLTNNSNYGLQLSGHSFSDGY